MRMWAEQWPGPECRCGGLLGKQRDPFDWGGWWSRPQERRSWATRAGVEATGWGPEPEMTVGTAEGMNRGVVGGGRHPDEGGREAWPLFTAAPPQKGRWGLRSDRSRNKSKSVLCWWSYVESNDLCYFCFSLETKEQTNKIRFHPPSGSILMSLYLCDMVSSSPSPFASGKRSLRSWLHKAFIFRSAVAADTSPQSRRLHRLSTLSGRVYHHSDSLASIFES